MQISNFQSNLFSQFSNFAVCGFAGRSGLPVPLPVLSLAKLVFNRFPKNAIVGCGCCSGVPAVARAFFGSNCKVFSSKSFKPFHLVQRSILFVNWAVSSGALWVSFPVRSFPVGLVPSKKWVSCGSGSWSSLALAVGLGCKALVYCPGWCSKSAWPGFFAVGGGFWCNHVA